MNSQQLAQEFTHLHAELCAALADPTRILLLYALAEKPRTVNDLAEEVGILQTATSRHLKILREHGLAHAARQGQHVEYSLADARLIDALDILRAVLRDNLSRHANLLPDLEA
jgi:DNA-binding transcriptional ArsR family regulator